MQGTLLGAFFCGRKKVNFMGMDWIKNAIKQPGAFSAQAQKAGMGTMAFASKVLKKGSKASEKTKKRANLAKTLSKLRKKKGTK